MTSLTQIRLASAEDAPRLALLAARTFRQAFASENDAVTAADDDKAMRIARPHQLDERIMRRTVKSPRVSFPSGHKRPFVKVGVRSDLAPSILQSIGEV